jgi:trans-aconitate 2-methyltransferase
MADPHAWDAAAYHTLSKPQLNWAMRVLEGLAFRGDETVVDAGCGSGLITQEIARRVPAGKVIAIDLDPGMIAEAERSMPNDLRARVRFVRADLAELDLGPVADLVFSTAALHWVLDQRALYRSLFGLLRGGGRLVAQYGGGKNLARLRDRFRAITSEPGLSSWFSGFEEPWIFLEPDRAREIMREAGFVEIEAWLEEAPAIFPDRATYEAFVGRIVLRGHLARVPDEARRHEIVTRLADLALSDDPPLCLDYWRLNVRGSTPA